MSELDLSSRQRDTRPHIPYHIMNRGIARQSIFTEDLDYLSFLSILGKSCQKYDVKVIAFCLMPNHYHLLVYPEKPNLSRFVQLVDSQYVRRFNYFHKRDGSLFRGRFRSETVESIEYLRSVVDYIHHNPTKANICANPSQYRWSSAGTFESTPSGSWFRPQLAGTLIQ